MTTGTVVTSFDVVVPTIRRVELDRPWQWLAQGWRDLTRAPLVSIWLGLVFAVVSWLLTFGLWWRGYLYLVLPMATGFMIVGPILAIGFYEISRRLAAGERVDLLSAFAVFRRNPRQIAVMGFILLLVLLTWIRIAAMIFMLYWGLEPPSFQDLIVNTFLRASSLPFLIVGMGVGGLFAFLAFAISAVSIPMLADQPRVDAITAIVTSVRAVRENLGPMLLWAALIAAATGVGLATLYLGLIVTVPLLGYATWHAYRDLVSRPEVTERGHAQPPVVPPGPHENHPRASSGPAEA
jgi:uncharacterized membrane protein